MTRPHIQPRYRTFTDSSVLDGLALSLREIRTQDGVTNADLARTLGKSPATVERYLAADRAMPVATFIRGCRDWDGRFADRALALAGMRLVPIDAPDSTDQHALADLCGLAAQLAAALQDGIVSDAERTVLGPAVRHVIAELGRLYQRACLPPPVLDTS